MEELGDGENTDFETVFVLADFDSPDYSYLYKRDNRIIGPPVVLHCAAKEEVSHLFTQHIYFEMCHKRHSQTRWCNREMIEFIPVSQMHLPDWSKEKLLKPVQPEIQMKNVQLHSGIYVCLMFYHVGRTHQRRVWDEPWFHKAGCKGTLWLWTGWWSGAASACCAVCLTETLRRMQIPNMNITSWLWLLRLHSVSRKTGLSWKIIYGQGPKSYLPWLKLHLKNIFIYFF